MVESRWAMTMRRAPLAQFGDRLLHVALGFGVERRRSLVEQDDRRILDQRAGDGDALALAAGELQPVFADRRIVSARQAEDEIVRMRRLGGGDDLRFAGVELAERDVLADRAAEQMNDLPDIGGLFAQRAPRHACYVLSVDQDAPGIGVVEAQDQAEHCRFAAARRPDQGRELAGLGDEAHAAQYRRAGLIGEMHIVEFEARGRELERRQASSLGSPAGLSITS